MDKNKILQFVAQLQELRDNVEDFMYFSTIPVNIWRLISMKVWIEQ